MSGLFAAPQSGPPVRAPGMPNGLDIRALFEQAVMAQEQHRQLDVLHQQQQAIARLGPQLDQLSQQQQAMFGQAALAAMARQLAAPLAPPQNGVDMEALAGLLCQPIPPGSNSSNLSWPGGNTLGNTLSRFANGMHNETRDFGLPTTQASSRPAPETAAGFRAQIAAGHASSKHSACDSSQDRKHDPANLHNSLRSYLEEDLKDVDKACVFITRRIKKLGFKSKDFLKKHFAKHGEVVEVFVTHPRSKPDTPTGPPKMRPGNFGIVVMKSPTDVKRILALGAEQVVRSVEIAVDTFQPMNKAKEAADGKAEESSGYRSSTAATQSGSQSGTAGQDNSGCSSEGGEQNPLNALLQMVNAERLSQWDLHQHLLRTEADRLHAEADAILAVAEQADRMPILRPAVAKLVAGQAAALGAQESLGLPRQASPFAILQTGDLSRQVSACPPGLELPLPPGVWAKTDYPGDWRAKAAQSQEAPQEAPAPAPEAAPVAKPASVEATACSGTLSDHLKQVTSLDPNCVFVARQLRQLGFQSRDKLRQHFSQYGKVAKVLVADKRVKSQTGLRITRPGGLGLIVMKNAASVEKILSEGEEQIVYGHKLVVQAYGGGDGSVGKLAPELEEDIFTPGPGDSARQTTPSTWCGDDSGLFRQSTTGTTTGSACSGFTRQTTPESLWPYQGSGRQATTEDSLPIFE